MWKYSLESVAGPDSGELDTPDGAGRPQADLWRYIGEAALLLGMLLASSWLMGR
jgi:hypothetical protein